MFLPLIAAHISDGVLRPIPQLAGIAVAIALLAYALRRLPDEAVPRVVLCTATFFVASLIRIPVGITSVHLLLNGLIGLLLGPLSAIPIGIGLLMQAALFGHGGFFAWGINACIFAVPALGSRPLFRYLRSRRGYGSPPALAFALALGWLLCPLSTLPLWYLGQRLSRGAGGLSALRAGFAVGFAAALATASLNGVVLVVAGIADWRWLAAFGIAAHFPLALVEGAIAGFAVEAIAAGRPELLEEVGR